MLIGILLAIFQQFSGINAIIYYGPNIFQQAGLTNGDALHTQVIIGAVNVLFTFLAISLTDKVGRKPLLITGLTGIVLSLLFIGVCFYTGYTASLLLIVLILLFIACFAFSIGPLTWTLINEIFPTDVRVQAVSICTFAVWAAAWMVGQFFPWLLKHIGAAGVFWLFALFSLVNLFFCLKVIKETKGKSLEEAENVYVSAH